MQDHITLRELAGLLRASYFTAYSLAVSGSLGEPLVIGRTYFYRRDLAEEAVRNRLEEGKHGKHAVRLGEAN